MKVANNYESVCGARKFFRSVLGGLMIATLGATSHAAIYSWSGGGADGNWSDAVNWGFTGVPTNGDTVIFSASQPQLSNTNDIFNLTLNEIRFVGAGGGYSIYGNAFTLTNDILATNTTGVNAISATIIFTTADINITVSNSLVLAGSLTGSTGFSKNGAGDLTLTGTSDNTYNGTTHVNDGTLDLSKSGNAYGIGNGTLTVGDGIGSLGSAQVVEFGSDEILNVPVVVYGDGEVNMNGNNDVFGNLVSVNDGGRILNSGSGVLTLLNGTTIQTDMTNGQTSFITSSVDVGTSTCTFTQTPNSLLDMTGNISGSAAITQSGQGQVFFSASNSFTGTLTINGGAVIIYDSWALGSTSGGTIVNEPGLLAIGGAVDVVGEPLTLNTTVGYFGYGALYDYGGTSNVWGGPITLDVNAPIDVASGQLLNITGPISGTGGVVVPGAGVLVYSGSAANTYAGTTTVNNGTLALDSTAFNAAIPGNVVVDNGGILRLANDEQIDNAANVTVNAGGLFDFSTFFESIDTLTGSGNVTFGVGGYLNIGLNNGTSTFNGLMSGTGYLGGYTVGKSGSGSFTMTANNTYQNGSDVFGGTLVVNGTQPQSPVRAMYSGTTLGGSGEVGDILSASGIAPGVAGAPAIFTCSNIAFSAGGNFTVRLDGPNPGTGYDQLVVLGSTINLSNAALNVLPGQPPTPDEQFTIIHNLGSASIFGIFNGLPNNAIVSGGGYTFRINYNGGASGKDVVLTAIGGNTMTLNSVDKGWYDSTGFHNSANANYLCGGDGGDTLNFYRNFFVFNAPTVSGASIISAELIINCYATISPQKELTYLVRGVSTPIGTLEAGGSGLTGIYDDLGSNAVYSERSVETDEGHQFAIIPLNVKFMNDIMAAAGGQIALGGSIPNPATNAYVFANSGFAVNDVQLRLTYGNVATLNSADTGWYDNTGFHQASNSNYLAGVNLGTSYHDYFMYNLPAISAPLVYAELLVSNYNVVNPGGSNLYQLYDVTTPIATLTNSASGATGTFADLGSGVSYGGRDIYVSESDLQAGIPLDSEFVSAVYANSGGQIALGGAVSETNGLVFGGSNTGNPANAQLWLGFLSAPATTPVFVDSSNIANDVVQFTLSGTSGTSNEIQASFDFTNWDYVGDLNMTNTTSVFLYTNSSLAVPAGYPYRFFRAKITP